MAESSVETFDSRDSHRGSVGVVLLLGVLDLLDGVGGRITISADMARGGAGRLMVGPRFLILGAALGLHLLDVEGVGSGCDDCVRPVEDLD